MWSFPHSWVLGVELPVCECERAELMEAGWSPESSCEAELWGWRLPLVNNSSWMLVFLISSCQVKLCTVCKTNAFNVVAQGPLTLLLNWPGMFLRGVVSKEQPQCHCVGVIWTCTAFGVVIVVIHNLSTVCFTVANSKNDDTTYSRQIILFYLCFCVTKTQHCDTTIWMLQHILRGQIRPDQTERSVYSRPFLSTAGETVQSSASASRSSLREVKTDASVTLWPDCLAPQLYNVVTPYLTFLPHSDVSHVRLLDHVGKPKCIALPPYGQVL